MMHTSALSHALNVMHSALHQGNKETLAMYGIPFSICAEMGIDNANSNVGQHRKLKISDHCLTFASKTWRETILVSPPSFTSYIEKKTCHQLHSKLTLIMLHGTAYTFVALLRLCSACFGHKSKRLCLTIQGANRNV